MKIIITICIFLGQLSFAQEKNKSSLFDQEWVRRMHARMIDEAHRRRDIDRHQQQEMQARREAFFFATDFNKLVEKLASFADQYNAGTVDAKTAKAVRDAWAKLEKSNAWFDTQKKNESKDERCTAKR